MHFPFTILIPFSVFFILILLMYVKHRNKRYLLKPYNYIYYNGPYICKKKDLKNIKEFLEKQGYPSSLLIDKPVEIEEIKEYE